jgi:hypothetical protein
LCIRDRAQVARPFIQETISESPIS